MTEDQLKSVTNYAKLGITITVIENNKIKIQQTRLINGYILTNKQLYQRAKTIFPKKIIIPVVYSLNVAEITPTWINEQMTTLGINKKDLVKQLAIDSSSLSLYLSGKQKMNKLVKAAFYYYFLTFEINANFRDDLLNVT